MSISKFLNESIISQPLTEPIFIIDKGLKGWLPTIHKVLKKVPLGSVPEVICAFSSINNLLGSKIITPRINKSKNALSIRRDSINLPKDMATVKMLKAAQDFSQFKNDDTGFQRLMEIKKDVSVNAETMGRYSYSIVCFNTRKNKTPNDLLSNKTKVNEYWMSKEGRLWFVNVDAEATICHELGHVYDNHKRISGKREWIDIAQRWLRDGAPDYCKPISDPSGFNQGTYGESFAEAFANTIIHNGKDIPSYVKDYIKTVI